LRKLDALLNGRQPAKAVEPDAAGPDACKKNEAGRRRPDFSAAHRHKRSSNLWSVSANVLSPMSRSAAFPSRFCSLCQLFQLVQLFLAQAGQGYLP